MGGFFNQTKIDDLPQLDDYQIANKACCVTKSLAYEIFRFTSQQTGFPFRDPELMKRSEYENLNEHQMRPFNEFAIKLMRRFKQLKEENEGNE